MTESAPIRVLLVEDEELLADMLSRQLSAVAWINLVGVAKTVADAKVLSRERLDVVLMDFALPDGTGADATRAIKARWPAARVIMLSSIGDDPTILDSIQAGADGYLTKGTTTSESLLKAIRDAHAGDILLPRTVIMGIAQRVAAQREAGADRRTIEPLTPRELEVLRALTEGLATPEICDRLYIAPNTLRTHVQNIMGKLHVHSKLEAVSFALRHRIVEPPRTDV